MTQPLQGLDHIARAQYAQVAEALSSGKLRDAELALTPLRMRFPDDADVLHILAGLLARQGDHPGALKAVRQAMQQRPDDAAMLCTLGKQLDVMGQLDAAIAAFERACALQPGLAIAWYNLGVVRIRTVDYAAAEAALRRTLELAPDMTRASTQLADLLVATGRVEEAVAAYRDVLATRPGTGKAWWGLAGIKLAGLGNADVPTMQTAMRDPRATEHDRIALGFAIARVLDANERYTEAMGVLAETHAHAQRLQPWNAALFGRRLYAMLAAFAVPLAEAEASDLGHGTIFIVGLPRSGTTLLEQMLASHPKITGSGELRDLQQVLAEESRRRGQVYPEWVSQATPTDWLRLGKSYVERTARWRSERPYCTDKMPGNWMHVSAIRAMLPGAKVIVCRRDPVETCFSCYRQYMTADGQGWTHRFEDLATYWNGFDRAVRQWRRLFPNSVYEQSHEKLISDPERNVRALLAFCDLPFEPTCLDFYRNPRAVRSPNATQVREPLHATARAPRYGALLNPLKSALGFVDIMSAH